MQGRAEQHSQLGPGVPDVSPSCCTLNHGHATALPFVLLNKLQDRSLKEALPCCCCCAEMIHSSSITQLRLAAKKPEFMECTISKPKLHLFLAVNQEQNKLRETTGLWLKPSSEIWRMWDSLTLFYFNFLPWGGQWWLSLLGDVGQGWAQ